jgi:uncharacterized SAM-dependent methyltransferase
MVVEIDVLFTERELTREFLAALERRHLPEKFFYWLPLSVKAWLDLCAGTQPYKNHSRSYQLISQHATDLARLVRPGEIEVVSLGVGQGDKELLLLRALEEQRRKFRYRPVDSSQALLEIACGRALEEGIATRGLKADVEKPETFSWLARSADQPRLYLLLGNSLGVIDPEEFLRKLGRLLRSEDDLLVDGEIFSAQLTLAGYDNPVNRRFAFAPLASLGLEEGRDGDLVFEARNGRVDGLHLVGKSFRAARSLHITAAGQAVELAAGETIEMSASAKYAPGVFRRLLQECGGFLPLVEYFSDDDGFQMVLAAPAAR